LSCGLLIQLNCCDQCRYTSYSDVRFMITAQKSVSMN